MLRFELLNLFIDHTQLSQNELFSSILTSVITKTIIKVNVEKSHIFLFFSTFILAIFATPKK